MATSWIRIGHTAFISGLYREGMTFIPEPFGRHLRGWTLNPADLQAGDCLPGLLEEFTRPLA